MQSIIKRSDSNRVLILGNGFDLDLGWNTRFSDFMKSQDWPQNNHSGSILHHLERCRDLTDWFDLEYQIGVYASGMATRGDSKRSHDINREYFQKMVDGFKMYLLEATAEPIKSDSIAAIALNAILNNLNFTSIYSFNYSSLHKIAEQLVKICNAYEIPLVFKGSYRKANRSRLDSFTGIGDENAAVMIQILDLHL